MRHYRLLAVDLDGTLLTNEKRITKRTAEALQKAAAQGIMIVPVTGRPLFGLPEELVKTPGIRHVITSNGAVTTDLKTGERLRSACIGFEAAADISGEVMRRKLNHSIFIGGYGYCETPFYEMLVEGFRGSIHEPYIRRSRRVSASITDQIRLDPDGVENIWIAFRGTGERDEADRKIRGKWRVRTVRMSERELEIGSLSADKGLALTHLAGKLGVPTEEIVAIGDNENDLGMFRAAGTAVAMGNASPSVKAAAARVTDTNEEDGAAKVIEHVAEMTAG